MFQKPSTGLFMVQNFPTYDGNHSKGCAVTVVEIVELFMELHRQLSINVGDVLLQQISHLFGCSITSTYESNVTSLYYIWMPANFQGDSFFIVFSYVRRVIHNVKA